MCEDATLSGLSLVEEADSCLSYVGNYIIKRQVLSGEVQQDVGLSETVILPNLRRTETAFLGK